MKTVRVGIVGYGTVGQATAAILHAYSEDLKKRIGASIKVTFICRRSPVVTVPEGAKYTTEWIKVVDSSEVDIVVETMGGTEAAREVVLGALERGKPVVTANKNLLAKYGSQIQELAIKNRVPFGMEAAVAGGIPVLRAITDGMAGDRLKKVYGILNGTTNYILTQMELEGSSFADALAQAQKHGYAEANPAADIDGVDARDKICILARLAFHSWLRESEIPTFGIRDVTAIDLSYARQLNSSIRLIGYAECNDQGVEVSVRPWLVSHKSMLAKVEGVNNAVVLTGERIGKQIFCGPGAGADATGAAVVADLVEIARGLSGKALPQRELAGFHDGAPVSITETLRPVCWYLRLTVQDRPGILGQIANIIASFGINIDAVIQSPGMPKEDLSFVITVEPVIEKQLQAAIKQVNQLDFMLKPVLLLRMDSEV